MYSTTFGLTETHENRVFIKTEVLKYDVLGNYAAASKCIVAFNLQGDFANQKIVELC